MRVDLEQQMATLGETGRQQLQDTFAIACVVLSQYPALSKLPRAPYLFPFQLSSCGPLSSAVWLQDTAKAVGAELTRRTSALEA